MGFAAVLVKAPGQAVASDLFHDLGGAAEDRLDTAEPPELTIAPEISGPVLEPAKAGLHLASASRGGRGAIWAAITRQGIVWARGNFPLQASGSMHRWFPIMVPESPISVPKKVPTAITLDLAGYRSDGHHASVSLQERRTTAAGASAISGLRAAPVKKKDAAQFFTSLHTT